ncbi:transmembrane protein 255B [Boleophthalmus pectinirostris]|uniref:transmembrane protein 255B n=1 Tax=Boleophthalmus pectinirostris TaxID=150288 RepID=UPI00242EB136|nr:transmembrane protein 255B [Boleophthalmus pectinirostris]
MVTATIPATGSTDTDKLILRGYATDLMVRLKRALWLLLSMLSLSLLLVAVGIYTTTLTKTVSVSGYTSGIILTLGSFLGLLGLGLEENRRHLITAAIAFLSFGIITSVLCLMIDGAVIGFNMDMRPLRAGRCQYYSSGNGYLYENYYATVSCWTLEETCNITVRSGTCYCCDLYNCANGGYLNDYYEFVGVQSCRDVFILYFLIWSLTGLNLVVFTGILTAAVLGSIKNVRGPGLGFEPTGRGLSSPSAPLLMDASAHSAHFVPQLHPGASTYIPSSSSPPAAASVPRVRSVSQRFPMAMSHATDLNSFHFAPLSYQA